MPREKIRQRDGGLTRSTQAGPELADNRFFVQKAAGGSPPVKSRQLNANDQSVLGALGRSARPLSAYDILDRTRSGTLKAPVQVYRSLQKLEQRGLVHRIEALNAFIACSGGPHAHHRPGFVICRECGAVREFKDERIGEVAAAAAGPDFCVELISLEIYGNCGACQAGADAPI